MNHETYGISGGHQHYSLPSSSDRRRVWTPPSALTSTTPRHRDEAGFHVVLDGLEALANVAVGTVAAAGDRDWTSGYPVVLVDRNAAGDAHCGPHIDGDRTEEEPCPASPLSDTILGPCSVPNPDAVVQGQTHRSSDCITHSRRNPTGFQRSSRNSRAAL